MKALFRRDHAVFVGTVLAGYISIFFQPDPLSPERIALATVLTALFAVIGTAGFEFCGQASRRWLMPLYFIVQLMLGALLIWACNMVGQIWIALLPLVAHAVMALPPAWAWAFGVGVAGAFGSVFWLIAGWQAGLQAGLSYLAGVAFVGLFTQLTLEAQRTKEQVEVLAADLQAANAKLREYAGQIEELAIAKERNRLAREIHDSLGHYLTVVNVQLEAAQAVLDTDARRARGALAKAQSLTQEGLKDVRRSVAALRASPTENRPLPEALQTLADETRAAGVLTELKVTGAPRALPAPVELAMYRAAQEALTNIRKHSRASRAEVHLTFEAERLCLRVQDNGVGAASTEGGFGLVGLRERVQLLGGDVTLTTAPGQGLTLEVSVPA